MIRGTRQRQAILDVVHHSADPLTPQEICTLAKATLPRIGIATVYRFLRSMLEEGKLVVVEIPGEAPRYELAEKDHHHHFFCKKCGRVFDVPGCLSEVNRLAPKNFRVDSHEITLFGYCESCLQDK